MTTDKGTPNEPSGDTGGTEPAKPDPNLVNVVTRGRENEADRRADVADRKDEDTR